MRLPDIIPHVALLLLAQAVIDAGPAIVAAREGGMGLGSALIGAYVMQVSGLVLGAALAGYVADRRSTSAAVLTGALIAYVGLMTTAMAPMGSLASVMAGMGVAGVGHGFLLTAAFATAAAIPGGGRVVAIALLLGVPMAARLLVGTALAAGPAALLVGAAVVVGLAVVAARLGRNAAGGPWAGQESGAAESRASGARAVLAGMLLGVGALLAVAGVEPSRLSAALVVGALGAGAFEAIDAARLVMLTVGGTLVAGGMTVLLAGRRVPRPVRLTVPSVLLAAIAGTGIASALTQATSAGRLVEGAVALIGPTGALAGGLGLLIAAVLTARAGARNVVGVAGSLLLVLGVALGFAVLSGQRPAVEDVRPAVLIGVVSLGGALVGTALRHRLTDVHRGAYGLAAGAGVAAAGIGGAIGSMVGAGEGLEVLTEAVRGPTAGSTALVVAAVAVAGVTVALARDRPAVETGMPAADS